MGGFARHSDLLVGAYRFFLYERDFRCDGVSVRCAGNIGVGASPLALLSDLLPKPTERGMGKICFFICGIRVIVCRHGGLQKLFEAFFAFFRSFSKFSFDNYCFYGRFYGIFNMVDSFEERPYF